MNITDQIKALAVAIEDKDNTIRKLSAELGNLEVQNADYSQIVQELSDKLKLYEKKYGTVFKSSS
jgi:predicted  nucleic acid-binding Zn-ribbon protein|tara:strand:+ start:62 stop:256 length:195 start_codon:yes stop_codon:yes gene_type:complete